MQSLLHTIRRQRTLWWHRVSALPILVLMPHSSCNCRCVMCDIWKGNADRKQLDERVVRELLPVLRELGTRQVLLSGGEALLHPELFTLCRLLREQDIRITLLTAGLTLATHARSVSEWVNEVIVSLDGPAAVHNRIRNVPQAFERLGKGVLALKALDASFPVKARSVVHCLNYRHWAHTVEAARNMGVDSISFLPADLTSAAFNRGQGWEEDRQAELRIPADELPALEQALEELLRTCSGELASGFIVESAPKLRNIYRYYCASNGLEPFPAKRCNAPWVSAVIESDGEVRPCFFHASFGNIHRQPFGQILNSKGMVAFRRGLDLDADPVCRRCVCSLHLPPHQNPVQP